MDALAVAVPAAVVDALAAIAPAAVDALAAIAPAPVALAVAVASTEENLSWTALMRTLPAGENNVKMLRNASKSTKLARQA